MPGLGRIPCDHDHASAPHLLNAVRGGFVPITRDWAIPADRLDQGQRGWCVGFGWESWRRGQPEPDHDTNPAKLAATIYRQSRIMAGISGHDEGSTVHGGAQYIQKRKWTTSEPVWATDLGSVNRYLGTTGDVVVGLNWTEDMFHPDSSGVVHATGKEVGGHCFHVFGVDFERSLWHCENSWGNSWGQDGTFWLPMNDAARLLAQDGEACALLERHHR